MDNRIPRQDRNGVRTPVDLQRRYNFDKTKETVEEISEEVSSLDIKFASKVDKIPGKGLSTNDFNNAYKKKVDDNTEARHTHSNKDVIDNITQEDINKWNDTETSSHKHDNKELLDTYKQKETDLSDAVLKKHAHTNKAILDNINSSNFSRWNGIAFYESGETTDVNTTTEELVLSSNNTPDTGFWYVRTMFYGGKTATSNRTQVAYGYNSDKPIMTRHYIDGTWSDWTASDIISSSITDYEGYIWYANGLLEQWGRVSITPTAANTVTSVTVIFPITYDVAPDISAIPQAAYPNIITTAIGGGTTTEAARKSMVIYTTRTNTVATLYRWKATGYKNPFS